MRIVPPDTSELTLLGTLKKVHGINGEMMLIADNPADAEIFETEQVFILIDGLPVPFFLSAYEERSDTSFVLQFDSITSRHEAEKLIGCGVYIQKRKKRGRPSKNNLGSVQGYRVVDQTLGMIGVVSQIIEFPGHSVMKVLKGEKEILIPVHEDIILEVNDTDKTILINAPDGLIEMY